ncbi:MULTISPECIES: glycosyltransferase [Dermacoccus]|uniref:Glycosyl transferase family 28 C-terminal domain-containing protein n=3 Tax=Dermacoccus TaxID=57495 RepID=A0A417Z7D8_9MICO|nr:glycosyltransferase [Dermacoccus abyssi]RHW46543.1 hypothetical protein D1832_04640 [Dermacoccus abyssi]
MRIGYYVHHHGRGHATRAGVIGRAAAARDHAVTFLGSGPLPETADDPRLEAVVLPRDDQRQDAPFRDAQAGGALHWAPLGGGYAQRACRIAQWVHSQAPDVVVVDVSVEVAALVRLLGVPVVVVTQPGQRDDAPHRLAYDMAAALLAPWPPGVGLDAHLEPWRDALFEVGGLTRFDGACATSHRVPSQEAVGVFLVGGEGWDDPTLPDVVRAATPEVRWRTPSTAPGATPIETLLAQADVVVTHAGQNAIADVAAFGAPAVVVAQRRPFDEQATMGRCLAATGIARVVPVESGADEVARATGRALAEVARRGRGPVGAGWRAWRTEEAAQRAVDVVEGACRAP